MSEHPAVVFLRAELDRVEQVARVASAAAGGLQPSDPVEFILASQDVVTWETKAAERHIRAWMPAAVLRRVAADRQILAEHANDRGDCRVCAGEADYSDDVEGNREWFRSAEPWPCRTVLLLAEAWGWTEASG